MRIISGRFRGRDLGGVPDGVRPTSDRVRESLFSALGDLSGLAVLDLFAGTGALGLEAYSRGAERVVFVERSRKIARALRNRFGALELGQVEAIDLLVCDAAVALRRLAETSRRCFDLAFVDPPYAGGDREPILEALVASELMRDRARVVVEGPKRHPVAPPLGSRVVDERRYGDTLLTWLEVSADVGE